MNDNTITIKKEKECLFILNNLWLIISNITKPTKGGEVPELSEEDMLMI